MISRLPVLPWIFTGLMCMALQAPASAQTQSEALNMWGNQSQNAGLPAVPVKGPVTIDGKLEDWDLSGRTCSFADIHLRDEYSVETAAMWDKDYLYLALKWKDPTPLHNLVDPGFNPRDSWKGDAVQMRIKTDALYWLTAWNYAGNGSSNLLLDRWKDPTSSRKGMESREFFGKPGDPNLGDGLQMAFSKGQGSGEYMQEMRIPWKLIYKEVPEIKSGNTIRIGFEYIWGDASGKDVPNHRYADNLQPGTTDREFFWNAQNAWGDVQLMAEGNLSPRQYRAAGPSLEGSVAISLRIPKEATRFTVVVEDKEGRRVRNLVADNNPADFAVAQTAQTAQDYDVKLAWDGLDDEGKPVAPGEYRTRGLWHRGLDAVYDLSFYNPGTPAWKTADGSGAWGADHFPPRNVTAAGDWMIVGWDFAEGGSGLIGIGNDGKKKWGEIRGSLVTAANDRYVFSIMSGWHGSGSLCRYDTKTGAYAPFMQDGKERPFEVMMRDIVPDAPERADFKDLHDIKKSAFVTAMAADGKRLALALRDNRIAVLEADSARLLKLFPAPSPTSIAFSTRGKLYGILEGKLHEVDPETGKTREIATPGLASAGALAVNSEGNIAIVDLGTDQQVKVYSASGILISSAGKKGGRPIRGAFDPEAMSHVQSIAFDSKGDLWAVENWNFPRRVSVWGKDGRLVRDYVGNTCYSGAGCYLYDQDPSLAYVGLIELKLDRTARTSKVTRILWKADESRDDEPKSFDLDPGSNVVGQRFRSAAGGKMREYVFKQPSNVYTEPSVLFMEGDNGAWRPVAAIGMVGQLSGDVGPKGLAVIKEPYGDFAGLSAWDGFFWNDTNNDGRVQRAECAIVPAEKPAKPGARPKQTPIPMGACWNNTMDPRDLSYLTTGIYRIKPLRFTEEGAPIFGPGSIQLVADMKRLGVKEELKFNPVVTSDGHSLVGLQTLYAAGDSPSFCGIDLQGEKLLWTYPNRYPGVHASHKAPMPKAGLVIGPLKVMGSAKINEDIGEVLALRGNLGQDFFFTTDGLNVGALFRDRRYPGDELPADEAGLRGKSVAHLSEGGEPFSGWFGRQSDGKIRMTTSLASQAGFIVEIKGLDSIHRFQGPLVALTAEALAKTSQRPDPTIPSDGKAVSYRVQHHTAASTAGDEVWSKVPSMAIAKEGSPEKATAQMAYDDKNLYVRFAVTDKSPLKNAAKDITRLFKTGDAVDLQFGPAKPDRTTPIAGDRRIVFSAADGKPVAVLMAPIETGASKSVEKTYMSPVGPRHFDRVEKLENVRMTSTVTDTGYILTAAIPFADLGFVPAPGLVMRGDAGFISSDADGKTNIARTYWANPDTALTSDEPQESWLFPKNWGEFIFE